MKTSLKLLKYWKRCARLIFLKPSICWISGYNWNKIKLEKCQRFLIISIFFLSKYPLLKYSKILFILHYWQNYQKVWEPLLKLTVTFNRTFTGWQLCRILNDQGYWLLVLINFLPNFLYLLCFPSLWITIFESFFTVSRMYT